MKHTRITLAACWLLAAPVWAAEITIQNDSLTDLSSGAIQSGFVAGELAAVWLEAPCDGDLVAVQIFWRSASGTTPPSIERSISVHEAGTHPNPGTTLETIFGPVLTDGLLNEFRYLDENNVIPLVVPVLQGNEYVVAFEFENSPTVDTASLITDVDGCQAGKNAIYATPPGLWFDSCLLGVSGDFVIRAVVECPVSQNEVDLWVMQTADPVAYIPGEDLSLQITVNNQGPAAANATTLIDFFPPELSQIDWMCTPANGASCGQLTGSGHLTESLNLPAGGSIIVDVVGTVDVNSTATLSNTAQLVVPQGLIDVDMNNNAITLEVTNDLIFRDDFE